MRAQQADERRQEQQLALERRLQAGAALVFACVVSIVIVLRAGVHNVFTPGWWRH